MQRRNEAFQGVNNFICKKSPFAARMQPRKIAYVYMDVYNSRWTQLAVHLTLSLPVRARPAMETNLPNIFIKTPLDKLQPYATPMSVWFYTNYSKIR